MDAKFRAFQLDTNGSLFSFYKDNHYCLIEAKTPKGGIDVLLEDLRFHGKTRIDTLHITSWDIDHCDYASIIPILNKLRPDHIELPSYEPTSDEGQLCKSTILGYDLVHEKYKPNVKVLSKEYISSLSQASSRQANNVVYHSSYDSEKKNDMSLIKLFRSNGFNVLSLGDCESQHISNTLLATGDIIRTEVDILILPHHGADNGFITGTFLDAIKPHLAVCSSNHGNQYDHPNQAIRSLLSSRSIPLFTTKRGDVLAYHRKAQTQTRAVNLIANNEEKSSQVSFTPKRFKGNPINN
jgi:competence protein ComEC